MAMLSLAAVIAASMYHVTLNIGMLTARHTWCCLERCIKFSRKKRRSADNLGKHFALGKIYGHGIELLTQQSLPTQAMNVTTEYDYIGIALIRHLVQVTCQAG
eukprot:scaffold19001_cov46-Prasinocladus_malaysianus.AAC.1